MLYLYMEIVRCLKNSDGHSCSLLKILNYRDHLHGTDLPGLKTGVRLTDSCLPSRTNGTHCSGTLSRLLLFYSHCMLLYLVLMPWISSLIFSPWFLLLLLELPLAVQSCSGFCLLSSLTGNTPISHTLAFYDLFSSWLKIILTRSLIY